jgi:hypothetical protein
MCAYCTRVRCGDGKCHSRHLCGRLSSTNGYPRPPASNRRMAEPAHSSMQSGRSHRADGTAQAMPQCAQVCLHSKCLNAALPILDADVLDVPAPCSARDVILYYYYGGMIYQALKRSTQVRVPPPTVTVHIVCWMSTPGAHMLRCSCVQMRMQAPRAFIGRTCACRQMGWDGLDRLCMPQCLFVCLFVCLCVCLLHSAACCMLVVSCSTQGQDMPCTTHPVCCMRHAARSMQRTAPGRMRVAGSGLLPPQLLSASVRKPSERQSAQSLALISSHPIPPHPIPSHPMA